MRLPLTKHVKNEDISKKTEYERPILSNIKKKHFQYQGHNMRIEA